MGFNAEESMNQNDSFEKKKNNKLPFDPGVVNQTSSLLRQWG